MSAPSQEVLFIEMYTERDRNRDEKPLLYNKEEDYLRVVITGSSQIEL